MFTGTAGAALLTVLAPILRIVLEAIGHSFDDWLARQQAAQVNRELGAREVTSILNKENADAERKASELAVNRPDVGAVVAAMERGDAF
ncbi:hypothetical protein ACQR1Y_12300 [Bradyrhizobium sp. HKCCYLRH3099]|uniref:hypothetical protein n=1 Tax=unclassified Bradyrhizobium TaxID=2631580 RepID=UPI003EBCF0A7